MHPAHASFRDDRTILVFHLRQSTRGRYYYAARAVTRGQFALAPLQAEVMYDPAMRSVSGAGVVSVR